MLINVLRGSKNAEIIAHNYDKIKTYGQGAEHSFFDWKNYIVQLINIGAMEVNYKEGNTLNVTSFGNKILKGLKVHLTTPDQISEIASKKKAKTTTPKSEKNSLFEHLRALRLKIAKEENVPPYIIFTDKSLQEMAENKPKNENAFLTISGVGKQKLLSYGIEFMQAIIHFEKENKPQKNTKKHTSEETYELLQQGLTPQEISIKRNLQVTTIYSHFAHLYEAGKPIDLFQFVTQEEVNTIENAYHKLEKTTELKPIFEELKEEMPYHKIRLALSLISN